MPRLLSILLFWVAFNFFESKNTYALDDILLSEVPPKVLKAIDEAKVRIAACCNKYHFDATFLDHPYKARRDTSLEYQQQIYQIYSDHKNPRSDYYDFEVLPDGYVISFFNSSNIFTVHKNETPAPTKSKWQSQHVLDIGNDFLWALNGAMPKELGQSSITSSQDRNSARYCPWEWRIYWHRLAEGKYDFDDDDATVNVYENEGLRSIHINFGTRFHGVNFTPITREEALVAAIPNAEKVAHWKPLAGLYGSEIIDQKPWKAYLMVVKPDHWGSPEVTSIYDHSDPNGRLVWEFWFYTYASQDDLIAKRPRHAVAVDIDAQTKEWLGGNGGSL